MTEAEKIQQFYNLLTTSIDVIRNFADKIPGFTDLVREDQVSDPLSQSEMNKIKSRCFKNIGDSVLKKEFRL